MNGDQLTACQPTEAGGLERTRFFPRQLIAPADLTQDQIYFREKLRRHNRFLHGWGVVCGARVRPGPGECEIIIEPGYILGPYGDEILIDREVTIDLCHEGIDGNAFSPCGDALDPWCSNVRVDRRAGQRLYLAVRYAECQSRPVRVHSNGCGCDETECEYSRIRDSFAIKALTNLPTTYSDPMPEPSGDDIIRCSVSENGEIRARLCPDCPPEPWVILADVTLGDDNRPQVDCFAHRRYVVSFADYYYLCRPRGFDRITPTILVDRVAERQGAGTASILVSATRADGTSVYIPAYFTVEAGETYESLLAREGQREFYDPASNETFTLRELYSLASVNPQETVRSLADAVAPLQKLTLRINNLRLARTELEGLVDAEGIKRLEQRHAGAPANAAALPATQIKGVSARSTLGKKLAQMTVADVAALSREAFVNRVLEDVTDERTRARLAQQADEIWASANKVNNLSNKWASIS